ncbi:MAG: transcriptional regulator, TetR family [Solirubrobacterales bacterium]|nr:transcriptional regulator, TetR family [Solirubrobacterales bacterium]
MAARKVTPKPSRRDRPAPARTTGGSPSTPTVEPAAPPESGKRYRPLPTGMHGLDPELVKRDQRERLRNAMVELIAQKGYQAVRIVDLAKLARVSQPTFYSLFGDKEELFVSAYDEVAGRTYRAVIEAYGSDDSNADRLLVALRAYAELAAAEPEAMSLLVLGAFGAGPKALEHRSGSLEVLERNIRAGRDGRPAGDGGDLTVRVILGGIREVTAARLVRKRESELPQLAGELSAWASSYPRHVAPALLAPSMGRRAASDSRVVPASERARRAEGRLPSGRSDLPREAIVANQQERIVDATAAIVAEKGLAALTIPEIARRASVSHQTFYDIYPSKHDAFLGAQKVGMHQALTMGVQAWEAQMPDWPRAIAAGMRAVIDYVVSEPAHAHLSIVDGFGASPETIQTRDQILSAFATYFDPGYEQPPKGVKVPPIAAEAVVGGCWQVLHHYIENDRIGELPGAAPQMTYMLLTPFLGPKRAAKVALLPVPGAKPPPQAGGDESA